VALEIDMKTLSKYINGQDMKNLKDMLLENKNQKKFDKQMIMANLNFLGYYTEAPDVNGDGVYAAFARRIKNPQTPADYSLVYIGIGNIKERIDAHISTDHEKWAAVGCYAPSQEEIVYSYDLFSYDDGLSEIEKVLVNQAKPCYNTEYADGFESDCISIHIYCMGDKGCLKDKYNWVNPKWIK
jgi:hypothetical protein